MLLFLDYKHYKLRYRKNILKSNTLLNNKQPYIRMAHLVILGLLTWAIYNTLFVRHSFIDLLDTFEMEVLDWHLLILTCLLVLPNQVLETLKLRAVLRYASLKAPFLSYLKAVLAGVSLGMITPARLGEYAGRMVMVPSGQKEVAAYATFISSIGQNVVTLIFGIMGALAYSQSVDLGKAMSWPWVYAGSGVLLLGIMVIYFNLPKCIHLLMKLALLRPYLISISSLDFKGGAGGGLLGKVLLLSASRYIVYLLQYALILRFYGASLTFVQLFSVISCIYLLQSLLPLPFIIGLVARGEIALLLLIPLGMHEIGILLATLSLWIINLVLPALLGVVILWTQNGFNRKN